MWLVTITVGMTLDATAAMVAKKPWLANIFTYTAMRPDTRKHIPENTSNVTAQAEADLE